MKKNLAFTIAELVIVLGIIGVLSTMLVITFKGNIVNKKKVMFKKAYHIAERNVHDVVNDEDLYPTVNSIGEGLKKYGRVTYNDLNYGCNDGESSTDCNNPGESDSPAGRRNKKFCQLFGAKLNTVTQGDHCVSSGTCFNTDIGSATFSATPSFVTSDGIYWYLPKRRYDDSCTTQDILVDVNGDAFPNCEYSISNPDECPDPDRFRLHVDYSGKITVDDGSKEKEYLMSDSVR